MQAMIPGNKNQTLADLIEAAARGGAAEHGRGGVVLYEYKGTVKDILYVPVADLPLAFPDGLVDLSIVLTYELTCEYVLVVLMQIDAKHGQVLPVLARYRRVTPSA